MFTTIAIIIGLLIAFPLLFIVACKMIDRQIAELMRNR